MRKVLLIALLFLTSTVSWASDEPKTADDLIAKHLESIGTADARAKATSRGVDGVAHYDFVIRNTTGKGDGELKFASSGHKMRVVMNLGMSNYTGEDFVCDGGDVFVAGTVGVGKKSLLGGFVDQRWELLNEGVFGGTLSTAWALLDMKGRNVKLKYNGLKKVSGQQLLELRFEPKKTRDDLQIRLYFDPQTYRHVMTVYDVRIPAGERNTPSSTQTNVNANGGTRATGNSRVSMNGMGNDEARRTYKETFTDFKTVDGLTLPSHWTIEIRDDMSTTDTMKWNFDVQTIAHVPVNPEAFKMK